MVVIMLTIIIIGLAAVIIYFKLDNDSTKESVDDIVASSWETKEITTNTNDDQYIKIQFQFRLDNKKAKKEIEKRDFQVYDMIIDGLSSMKAEEFSQKEQLTKLENNLKSDVNAVLNDGEVIEIYTIEKIIQ